MTARLLPPCFRLRRRPAKFQFIDEIQRTLDTRRVVTGACDIQIELVSSNLQCFLETSRLVPRMLSPSCDVLQLPPVPVNLLFQHVCLMRINKTLLLKQKDEFLDAAKSLIPHIWHSRALVVFYLLFEVSRLSSTTITCCAKGCVLLASLSLIPINTQAGYHSVLWNDGRTCHMIPSPSAKIVPYLARLIEYLPL